MKCQSALNVLSKRSLPALSAAMVSLTSRVSWAAAGVGGGGLQWEAPLQKLAASIQGPVAYIISLLGMVVCGGILIWGGEIGDFVRQLFRVVLAISVLVFSAALLTSLFGVGALVP